MTSMAASPRAPDSNGAQAIRRYGVRGARQEAAEGFPTLFKVALPTLARTFDILAVRSGQWSRRSSR